MDMTKLDARKSGSFKVGGEIEIHRLGFGAMRITGKGIWGPPEDKPEVIRTLKRLPELGIDFVEFLRARRVRTTHPRNAPSVSRHADRHQGWIPAPWAQRMGDGRAS
jgi:hypothetical protein